MRGSSLLSGDGFGQYLLVVGLVLLLVSLYRGQADPSPLLKWWWVWVALGFLVILVEAVI